MIISHAAKSILGASTETPVGFRHAYATVARKRYAIDFSNSSKSVDARKPFYLVRNDSRSPSSAEYYALETRDNLSPAAASIPGYDHPVFHAQSGDSWQYVSDDIHVSATLVGTFRLKEFDKSGARVFEPVA